MAPVYALSSFRCFFFSTSARSLHPFGNWMLRFLRLTNPLMRLVMSSPVLGGSLDYLQRDRDVVKTSRSGSIHKHRRRRAITGQDHVIGSAGHSGSKGHNGPGRAHRLPEADFVIHLAEGGKLEADPGSSPSQYREIRNRISETRDGNLQCVRPIELDR